MKHDELIARDLRPPAPPPELEAKALEAARRAAAAGAETKHWIDRLWESHPLRLAWATTTVVLLVLHLFLAGGDAAGSPSELPASDGWMAEARQILNVDGLLERYAAAEAREPRHDELRAALGMAPGTAMEME